MGKPDTLDRLAQALIALTALLALGNGAAMLVAPLDWYAMVPTVRFTGPPNQHFIRDIGLAYLSCGVVLGWAARYPAGRWLAALAGALWLSVHAVLHVYEVLTGICAPATFLMDAPGVLGPPLLVWLAIALLVARRRIAPAGVPARLLIRALDSYAPGESAYVAEIARAPGHAFEKFEQLMPITAHRHDAPPVPFHMARIGAVLVEDCGPCAMMAARAALEDGVHRDFVNAALAAYPPKGDAATAFAFGQAIARQSADAAELGDRIEHALGRTARLELALTAATVRAFPAIKRGLGLGQSCALAPMTV